MTIEKLSVPKFNIGEKVFYLKDNKIEERQVLGIITLFENNRYEYEEGRKAIFKRYEYCFDIKANTSYLYWVDEERLFTKKEDLIKNL